MLYLYTINQTSLSLIISCLPVPSRATLLYLLPLSVLNAMPVTLCLHRLQKGGLALMMADHGELHHAPSYTALFIGSTGSN